jgi:hypothetical protein
MLAAGSGVTRTLCASLTCQVGVFCAATQGAHYDSWLGFFPRLPPHVCTVLFNSGAYFGSVCYT